MVADMNHLCHKWLKILVVQILLAGQCIFVQQIKHMEYVYISK